MYDTIQIVLLFERVNQGNMRN